MSKAAARQADIRDDQVWNFWTWDFLQKKNIEWNAVIFEIHGLKGTYILLGFMFIEM